MEEKENIWNIEKIEIDKELPVNEKLENFVHGIKEGTLTHLNEGYIVSVHFGKENYSATDALKHYLKQIAQIKY